MVFSTNIENWISTLLYQFHRFDLTFPQTLMLNNTIRFQVAKLVLRTKNKFIAMSHQ